MKACGTCQIELPPERFSPATRKSCTSCENRKYRERKTAAARDANARLKAELMDHYGGGRCACCGVTEMVWLTIDHVDGSGASHGRAIGARSARQFYLWLKRNNLPSGFQVLCFNCNWAKSHGGCPHRA